MNHDINNEWLADVENELENECAMMWEDLETELKSDMELETNKQTPNIDTSLFI